jgi:hypothetical protein
MRVFEKPGPINTENVVEIVQEASSRVNGIVVASVTGDSAVKVAEKVGEKKVVCVTCPQGMFWQVNEMKGDLFDEIPELRTRRDEWLRKGLERIPMNVTDENRLKLAELGVEVVRGTIPLFGATFSMRLHLHKTTSLDVIAKTLELISTGTLVCLETVLMAVDAGVVPEGVRVLACAGTEMGLDTAWIMRSCASANMFNPFKGFLFIELLAKPGVALVPNLNVRYIR